MERQEIEFARRLADTNKARRDKGVKKLRAWLSHQSSKPPGFSDVDMLKVWKGLFYCMWMSDKPLVQEELAATISKLIHSLLSKEQAFKFIKAFFVTMQREWDGIDFLRLDKFYMFIRRFLKESLVFLKINQWNEGMCKVFGDVLSDGPLSWNLLMKSEGICLHLTDVFLDELTSVFDSKLSSSLLNVLLIPFYTLIGKCKSPIILRNLTDQVFQPLLEGYSHQSDKNLPAVDFNLVAESLFSVAADVSTGAKNRKAVYSLRTKFLRRAKPEAEPEAEQLSVESLPKRSKRSQDSEVQQSIHVDDDISFNFHRFAQNDVSESLRKELDFTSPVHAPKTQPKRVCFSAKKSEFQRTKLKKKFRMSSKQPGKGLLKSSKPGLLTPAEKRKIRLRAKMNARFSL